PLGSGPDEPPVDLVTKRLGKLEHALELGLRYSSSSSPQASRSKRGFAAAKCGYPLLIRLAMREEISMTLNTLQDVFTEQLADLYSAEQQLLEALPKVRDAAADVELRHALDHHLDQ